MTDEVRPDLYRLTSPLRLHPLRAALIGLVLAVLCYLAAGVVTSRASSQARLDVTPVLEPAMVELGTVLPGSGLGSIGRLNQAPELTDLVSYLTQRNVSDVLGLEESIELTVVRDPLGTRASVVFSGPDESTVASAVSLVEGGLTAELRAQLRSDLDAARRGVAIQLSKIDAQLSGLSELDPDLVVRAALTNQRVALLAVDDVLDGFALDRVGVEYELTEEPTPAETSTIARVALTVVLWLVAGVAALGAFALVSDRVRSFSDVVRYADGARIAGLIRLRDDDGVAAIANGVVRADGVREVHLHATAAPADDLVGQLRAEHIADTAVVDVVAFGRAGRADSLRSVGAGVVDLVVVDWARTTRAELLNTVTQLRLAGAQDVGVIVRDVPGRAQSVVA